MRGARGGGVALPLVGRVAFELGIDQPIVGAHPRQRSHDRPAQVGIHLETGENLDAVEQAANDGEVLVRPGCVDERMSPRQLQVAPGRGTVEGPKRVIGKDREGGLRVGRVAIDPDRRGRLRQQILNHADIRLAPDVVENQRQVAARRQLGIPKHVP